MCQDMCLWKRYTKNVTAGVGFEPTAGLKHPARDFESPAFVRSATPPEIKIIGMLSMTGFGKGEGESERWKVTSMIRSLNGKGLDVSVRMPSFLMPLEPKIKDLIKGELRRGTVHVFVDLESKEILPPVDLERLKKNAEMLRKLTEEELGLSVNDDTVFEFAWKYSEKTVTEVDEELEGTVLLAVKNALKELINSRRREGEALRRDISERVSRIEEILGGVVQRKDEILQRVRERILERAKALGLPEEHPTVMNEILFLLERMDVEEEITRLKAHISRLRRLMEEREVGKKMEFLCQEMHREITTLGNKIPYLSEFVVEIKTEVDRIKQQAANVE